MSDFTTLNLQYNTGTDGSPTWTGTAIAFSGSAGANELRWGPSSGTGGSVASASWPYFTRAAVAVVPQLWAFTADTTGSQVNYDGTSAHYMELRWNWDNLGTFAAAPQFSMFGDNTHAAPVAGTQPGALSGSPIVNGQTTDTSSTSYFKYNAYGYGYSGSQQTPASNAAGTLAATTGTAGSVSPGTGAWLATWQSAQGWIQYILDGVTPTATTAGFWYWVCALYQGPNMSTGTMQPVVTFQYSYA